LTVRPGKPFAALLLPLLACSVEPAAAAGPKNYLFLGSGELESAEQLLERPDISGAQAVYSWKELEPAKDRYDFGAIDRDLAIAKRHGRQLFVQLQDRFFLPTARNVPAYILKDPEYGGGLARQADNPGENEPAGSGWVTRQWDPEVRARFQKLLSALAQHLDGKIAGLNLPESAADLNGKPEGFTCDAYFDATIDNLRHARKVFRTSHVVQYVNFWPCEWNNDRNYMGRAFAFAAANGIGLGGPDIVPYRRGQMKNAYPFFNRYKGKLPVVAMAVQQPTLTYTNPQTGKRFTKDEIVAFASDYLGVDIIFWTVEAPWLRQAARTSTPEAR